MRTFYLRKLHGTDGHDITHRAHGARAPGLAPRGSLAPPSPSPKEKKKRRKRKRKRRTRRKKGKNEDIPIIVKQITKRFLFSHCRLVGRSVRPCVRSIHFTFFAFVSYLKIGKFQFELPISFQLFFCVVFGNFWLFFVTFCILGGQLAFIQTINGRHNFKAWDEKNA